MYSNYIPYTTALEQAIRSLNVPSFIIHQKNEKDFIKLENLDKDCFDINKYVETILSSVRKCKNNSFPFQFIIENLNSLEENKNYFDENLNFKNNDLSNIGFLSKIFNSLKENGYLNINNFDEKTKFYTHNEKSFLENNGVVAKFLDSNISDKEKLIKLVHFINETLEKEIKSFSYYIEDCLFKEKFINPDITLKDIEKITKPLVEKYISLSGKSLNLDINNTVLLSEIEKNYNELSKDKNKEKTIKTKKEIKHIEFN